MEPFANIFFPVQAFQPHEREQLTFEQLMQCFAAHEREERGFLEGYRDLADQHDNPLVRFLLQMIMSDEEKHHEVVHKISMTLDADLFGRRAGRRLPKIGPISDDEKESLLRLTAEFIRTEKEGIKEYEALLKSSTGYYGGLLVLLIKTIIHDSEKHLMILQFIDEKLRES